ncbi:MAG TPA: hypothetical protein VK421_07995 [Pyrinomonadaceae bacterium]|nr:hypothetical protein [Pyrinomonadaceae bacterium]
MQPTPSREMLESDAGAVTRSSHPQSLSETEWWYARGVDEPSRLLAAEQRPDEGGGTSGTLDDVARREREDMRPRLRDELGREPTEEELDEWLRRHTEGY